MKLKTIAYSLLMLCVLSCKKEAGPKGDQGDPGIDGYTSLIKLTPFTSNTSCAAGGVTIESGIDKNQNNIFDDSNNSVVELYNVTDHQVIAGSTLSSNNLNPGTFIQTGNLYNSLPGDREITLGISQHSSKEGFYSYSGSCYLFLYRR